MKRGRNPVNQKKKRRRNTKRNVTYHFDWWTVMGASISIHSSSLTTIDWPRCWAGPFIADSPDLFLFFSAGRSFFQAASPFSFHSVFSFFLSFDSSFVLFSYAARWRPPFQSWRRPLDFFEVATSGSEVVSTPSISSFRQGISNCSTFRSSRTGCYRVFFTGFSRID